MSRKDRKGRGWVPPRRGGYEFTAPEADADPRPPAGDGGIAPPATPSGVSSTHCDCGCGKEVK